MVVLKEKKQKYNYHLFSHEIDLRCTQHIICAFNKIHNVNKYPPQPHAGTHACTWTQTFEEPLDATHLLDHLSKLGILGEQLLDVPGGDS